MRQESSPAGMQDLQAQAVWRLARRHARRRCYGADVRNPGASVWGLDALRLPAMGAARQKEPIMKPSRRQQEELQEMLMFKAYLGFCVKSGEITQSKAEEIFMEVESDVRKNEPTSCGSPRRSSK
ncbi:MAG: hypothetical protein ACKO0Z_11750 [Betaproteobacteria bacterium]